MESAQRIVSALLEQEGQEFDPREYLLSIPTGDVDARSALTANVFYHRTMKYADGRTAIQVRRNGRTKIWKRQPDKFSIPVKYGFRDCFYIDNRNAADWSTEPIERLPSARERARQARERQQGEQGI
jgi:hypothetical protein